MKSISHERKTAIRDLTKKESPLVTLVDLNEKELLLVCGGLPPRPNATMSYDDSDE